MPDEVNRTVLAPLPSRGGEANTPMPEDATGASSPPDAAAAPSAEDTSQAQSSEQAPPPSSQPEPEKKFNMPPPERWEELRRERDEARRLAELALQRVPPPQAAPQHDPWEGLVNHPDPATAQFYQQQRALIQYERQQAKQEAVQELLPVINAGREEIARLNSKEFRKENPDIKPGSEEERLVVSYMNGDMDGVRHTLESAKRNAMYDRLEAENRALKAKQSALPRKAAANVESSSGIPEASGLPGQPMNWRQKASEVLDKGGDFVDVANTLFGKKRKL